MKPLAADRCQRGAELFEMLNIVTLTIQQRAEDCDDQKRLIEALQTGLFKMNKANRLKLCNHVITAEDVQNDPSWISDAIVLVLRLLH
jgi:hypothetical protein